MGSGTEGQPRAAEELFHEALDLDPSDRAAFLDEACDGDLSLRSEVQSLIDADGRARGFIEAPAIGLLPDAPDQDVQDSLVGRTIGPYRVIGKIASGGMGTVYEARREQPPLTVALKVMHFEATSPTLLRRFQYESEFLARLHHSGIAHIYDAGLHREGALCVPYIAMELIAGARTITDYARSERLNARDRLELFRRVCEAIQHGHQNGVIHRDLKPANILVDSSGQPRVIDFGIARAIDPDATTFHTGTGKLVGTIQYMSPEQTTGTTKDLDVRADVYSLGVVLYELLCGALPYDVADMPLPRAAQIIQEVPPRRPSTHLHDVGSDLETITLKALEKDRERRYRSAAALADDISRFLLHKPIEARPPTWSHQVKLFARRHKVGVGASVVIFLVLVAAVAISTSYAYRAARERDSTRAQSYLAHIAAADAALREFDVAEATLRLEQTEPELRRWEWQYLASRLDRSGQTLMLNESGFLPVSFDRRGTRILSASIPRQLEPRSLLSIREIASGKELVPQTSLEGRLTHVGFSPDDEHIVCVAKNETENESKNENITILDRNLRSQLAIATAGTVTAISFSPDGRTLAAASEGTQLWRMPSGEPLTTLKHADVQFGDVAFDPAGERLAAAATDATVRVWELRTREQILVLRGHAKEVTAVTFGPEGKRLVSASRDTTLRVWDAETGEAKAVLDGHRRAVLCVAFDPGGRWIASGCWDGTINLWDPTTGAELTTLWGHTAGVSAVAFDASGDHLVSHSVDGSVKHWNLQQLDPGYVLERTEELIRCLAYAREGPWIASGSFDGVVRVHDSRTGQLEALLTGHRGGVESVAFSPDGALIASGSRDLTVKLWDRGSRTCLATLERHTEGVTALAFSADGALLASGSPDGTALLWDVTTRSVVHDLPHGTGVWIRAVCFDPAGDRLATASSDGLLRMWDLRSGALLHGIPAHSAPVNCVAFSPTEDQLATGSDDSTLTLWNTRTWEPLATLHGHSWSVNGLAYSPDGTRLVSVANAVRLWDPKTGQLMLTLRGHHAWIWCVAFNADGTRIASGGGNYNGNGCSVRLWGKVPGRLWPQLEDSPRRGG